ncbi:MAG: class I SAM-dependent methyltransferase [Chloroflexi bacterium]|nr:class I SAM-dependent methyltransferase [Chloroflexota bacterium]
MTAPHDDEALVRSGYDTLYAAWPRAETLHSIWRRHALGAGFPPEFTHISFATLAELRWVSAELGLERGKQLVDLACGTAGPGLWLAREADALLTGVDLSPVALERARERAADLGLAGQARFVEGTFAHTGLFDASLDGAVSFDALQYAPDKRAALAETARILKSDARLVFTCFETEPDRVRGVPVMGTDPVADYAPLLEGAGFDVTSYAEDQGWQARVESTYAAVIDARESITREIGAPATNALVGEMQLTLRLRPYRRRILAAAVRR